MRGLLARVVHPPGGQAAKTMVLTSLVDWCGTGIWITVSVLYFSRIVGVSNEQIGVGMTAGGVLGLLAVIPVTALTRRHSARNVAVGLHLLRAVGFSCYLLVDSVTGFFLVVALVAVVDRPSAAVNQLLVAETVPIGERTTTMALLHVATNVGISAGALIGTLALAFESASSYRVLIVADSLTFLVAALLISRLSVVSGAEAASASTGRRPGALTALRDRRFTALTVGNGLLALHIPLLNVVTPLWLAERTDAPVALMGGLLLLNTVLVVVLQVRVAKRAQELNNAARVAAVAGFALTGACACLAFASELGRGPAVLLLVAGVALVTFGEIGQGASGWVLSFGLAPEDGRRPSYLGLFALGPAAATVFGPALLTFGIFRGGYAGWLAVMAVTAGAGLLVRGVALKSSGSAPRDALLVESG